MGLIPGITAQRNGCTFIMLDTNEESLARVATLLDGFGPFPFGAKARPQVVSHDN